MTLARHLFVLCLGYHSCCWVCGCCWPDAIAPCLCFGITPCGTSAVGARKWEFAPGQVTSVWLTANRSLHLRNKDGKKLASIETNMRGIPRFAEWLESTNLAATLTPNMEKQTKQADQEESTVQWREEYRTRWHDHIKGIRIGLWVVIVLFAIGVLIPIPLYLFADAKFTTVMKIGALAPIPFLIFCLVFAPVLLFDDRPKNAALQSGMRCI